VMPRCETDPPPEYELAGSLVRCFLYEDKGGLR
jgi:hypothetical protein